MRIKYISKLLVLGVLTTALLPANGVLASDLNSNALGIIIPYVEDHNVDSVNIVDLAKAMHVEVKKVDGGIQMYLNNKTVAIYDNDSTIYINGSAVPYKTTKMKDFDTGEYYEMPISQKPTRVGDGYLVPKSIIKDKIGIDCASDGIHVADITVPPTSSVDNSASYSRTTTSTSTDGWKNESGVWYYLKNGAKATGWIQDGGKWYYLGTDGKMQVGWVQDGANWYYLNGDGSMAHDTTVGGYYLGSNGAWETSSNSSSSGSATGISYEELKNRVESLGFVDREYASTTIMGDLSGYGWYWKDYTSGSISIYDNGGFHIQLKKNNAEFHKAVLQIFNWLLPTQGNELNNILSTNPQNETLTMDGRTVKITMYADAIGITITG
ncbi:hypothetical protein [Clostridium beijerinckii]|uniref:hypothetical protein n=1 Tax=Clostridium beijerinckii TaxID=1520 RepID=UPI0022E84A2E|nr:hypothetical protein [Clostridium beijerinckii]